MIKLKSEIINYTFIFVGAFFLALGMVGFLIPNKIATGGIAGLSIIFHHLFQLPTGFILAVVNIPLLLLSINYLGKKFAIRTIIAIIFIAVMIDFLTEILHFPTLSSNTLLSSLYGGVSVGLGLGFIFKGEASAGAGTIIAKILHAKIGVRTGDVLLVLDALVVIAAGVVFKDIELALWSLISIYVASKLINMILTGNRHEKVIHISTNKETLISEQIIKKLGIKGTVIKGSDLNFENDKTIILIVVEISRLNALKSIIKEIDPDAFMVVMEASEMLGSSRHIDESYPKSKLFS
ncbi:MAG: YitT family protein [Vicingaceae bacterium]|nr:YitT family protein [Vicingaceae bacterium]